MWKSYVSIVITPQPQTEGWFLTYHIEIELNSKVRLNAFVK